MTQHSTGEHRPRKAGWHVAVVALSASALACRARGLWKRLEGELGCCQHLRPEPQPRRGWTRRRQIPTKFNAPGPAVDASRASGKTACLIAADLSVPFTKDEQDGAIQALNAAGVR